MLVAHFNRCLAAPFLLPVAQGGDGVVHAQVLVISGNELVQSLACIEEDEVFEDIEQAFFLACALDQRVEPGALAFTLVFDAFPLEEVFPGSGEAAHFAGEGVGNDDEGVVPEKRWQGCFVVAGDAIEGVLRVAIRDLQQNERETIDEADQVEAALSELAVDPEAGDEREVVFVGFLPVDDLQCLMRILARFCSLLCILACNELSTCVDFDAIFEQRIDLLVGAGETEQAAVICERLDGLVDERVAQARELLAGVLAYNCFTAYALHMLFPLVELYFLRISRFPLI